MSVPRPQTTSSDSTAGAVAVSNSSKSSSSAASPSPSSTSDSTSLSGLPPGQPAIRMTDSTSGPNGPSLKFAALSVDSYHLDSPPFTGAAMNNGPHNSSHGYDQLDAAGRQLPPTESSSSGSQSIVSSSQANSRMTSPNSRSRQPSSNGFARGRDDSSSVSSADHGVRDSRTSAAAAAAGQARPSLASRSSSSSRSRSGQGRISPDGQKTSTSSMPNNDVPQWDLDENRRTSTSASTIRGVRITDDDELEAIAQGDRSTLGRPLHTQLTDDSDGVRHYDDQHMTNSTQHEPDQEVDGDGIGFVLRGGDGQAASHEQVVPVQSQRKADYNFPRHRLPLKMRDESKIPLVIVACGSFSPPTYLHLRIFEMAKDQVIESGKYELLAGYYSPVSDHYHKKGLAKARHRVRMCELAVEKTSTWLMVDAWESLQDEYQRTAVVLDHFNDELNGPLKSSSATAAVPDGGPPEPVHGGVLLNNGRRRRIKIMLLAGGDLIQSMGEPNVWADQDLHHILGKYGCMIVERTGADVWSFLLSHDLLWKYRRNLKIVKQTIYNDISSSKVRLFVRRGQSIKYLLPNSVIKYIEQNNLYRLPLDEVGLAEPAPEPDDENW
ncbi:unnamed protein product [Sympodiomycopsis kandeliae]